MKVISGVIVLAILLVSTKSVAQRDCNFPDSLLTTEEWTDFSENIARAVVSENDGVVEGALTQIVRYGELMEFPELTVFDVMRIVRDHPDRNMRRLAVVAACNMNSRWAVDYIDMISRQECEHCVKYTMESAVAAANHRAEDLAVAVK